MKRGVSLSAWWRGEQGEHSPGWLFLTTVLALLAGVLSSLATYYFKRGELVYSVGLEIGKSKALARQQMQLQKDERVRQQVIGFANPILGAVEDLDERLRKILEKQVYQPLGKAYTTNPRWSGTYDYFMTSTLYLFAQYFAWNRILQEELSMETFRSSQQQNEFADALERVTLSLAKYPPDHVDVAEKWVCSSPTDSQVYRLQQRAIGELLIIGDGIQRRCMGYGEFFDIVHNAGADSAKEKRAQTFRTHLAPLRALLEGVSDKPIDQCRWRRLQATHTALKELKAQCRRLLSLPDESSQTVR